MSILPFPGYSEFHTGRNPDEATHSNNSFGFSKCALHMKCCVTIVTTCFQFCLLFCPILWHNSCSVQFIRGEDQMSKLHRLGSDFLPHLPNYHHQQIMQDAQNTKLSKYQISSTKLSPVANTAGCTKYQIITGGKTEAFANGEKFQLGQIS